MCGLRVTALEEELRGRAALPPVPRCRVPAAWPGPKNPGGELSGAPNAGGSCAPAPWARAKAGASGAAPENPVGPPSCAPSGAPRGDGAENLSLYNVGDNFFTTL